MLVTANSNLYHTSKFKEGPRVPAWGSLVLFPLEVRVLTTGSLVEGASPEDPVLPAPLSMAESRASVEAAVITAVVRPAEATTNPPGVGAEEEAHLTPMDRS